MSNSNDSPFAPPQRRASQVSRPSTLSNRSVIIPVAPSALSDPFASPAEAPTSEQEPPTAPWSVGSTRLAQLREQRDQAERIEMGNIYAHGSLDRSTHFFGGNSANVARSTAALTPPVWGLQQAAQGMQWEQTSESDPSTPRKRTFNSQGHQNQLNYGGVQLFPPAFPQRGAPSTGSDRTRTTTSSTRFGRSVPVSLHAGLALHQFMSRLQAARRAEIDQLAAQRANQIEGRGQRCQIQQERDAWRVRYEQTVAERDTHLAGAEERDGRLTQVITDWIRYSGDEYCDEVEQYVHNCQLALPGRRYRFLCALMWTDKIRAEVRDAVHDADLAEMKCDKLIYNSELYFARSRGDGVFKPKDQETYPLVKTGQFGFEFDPDIPSGHVCDEECFCEFIEPQNIELEAGYNAEQQYLMAGLKIRMRRIEGARNVVNGNSPADWIVREKAPFRAFHCWLVKASDYIHDRAHHPERLHTKFRAVNKAERLFDSPDEWKEFQTEFHGHITNLFVGNKKKDWQHRVPILHFNPVTWVDCEERAVENDTSDALYRGPEWFEHAGNDDDSDYDSSVNSVATITPSRGPQRQSQTPLRDGSGRRSLQPAESMPSQRKRQVITLTGPQTPMPPPRSARGSVDADGDSEMGDDETTPKASAQLPRTSFQERLPSVHEEDHEGFGEEEGSESNISWTSSLQRTDQPVLRLGVVSPAMERTLRRATRAGLEREEVWGEVEEMDPESDN